MCPKHIEQIHSFISNQP